MSDRKFSVRQVEDWHLEKTQETLGPTIRNTHRPRVARGCRRRAFVTQGGKITIYHNRCSD